MRIGPWHVGVDVFGEVAICEADEEIAQIGVRLDTTHFAASDQAGKTGKVSAALVMHLALVPSGLFIGNGLNDAEVHLRMRRQASNLGGDLGPVPEFGPIALEPAASSEPLGCVVSVALIVQDQGTRIGLPAPLDVAPFLKPVYKKVKHPTVFP